MESKLFEQNLLDNPLYMLGGYKAATIIDIIETNTVSDFLEIGTWVGGSTYALSRLYPNMRIDTIDINNFQEMYDKNAELVKILENWLDQSIDPETLKNIQYTYRKNSSNVVFHNASEFKWGEKVYDVILIDGDHSVEALEADLKNSFNNIRHKGVIIVDDIAYTEIRKTVLAFCRKNRQKWKFTSLEKGNDLALIKVRKKF